MPKKIKYERRHSEYSVEDLDAIRARTEQIFLENNMGEWQEARIYEVLDRYQGDAGLSVHAVNYLASAIMHVIENS